MVSTVFGLRRQHFRLYITIKLKIFSLFNILRNYPNATMQNAE